MNDQEYAGFIKWCEIEKLAEGHVEKITLYEGDAVALEAYRDYLQNKSQIPSGEGEAVRVPGAVERPCDCSGCYCGNSGDAESVGYADGWNACRAEMLTALRPPVAPVGDDVRERWVGRLTIHLADYVNGLAPTLRIGETDAQELLALLRTPSGDETTDPIAALHAVETETNTEDDR